MNKYLALVLLVSLAFGCCTPERAAQERDAFHWNTLIGRGVNLGNALDAPHEGDWGVRLQEGHFALIRRAGFSSVRLPVRWSAHAESTPPYRIDNAFLARVDRAVAQALKYGLVVVLAMHHYEEMATAPEAHRERFLALWSQMAEHYKAYPETLYFELLNEPHDALSGDLWNEYAGQAIRLIRRSNPRRALVVGPTAWNNIGALPELHLPPDDGNLIVTFHYYNPYDFTHQGAEWLGEESRKWLGATWTGTKEERQAVIADLDQAARWGRTNGVPLYMGEFGVYSAAAMDARVRWTSFVRAEAEKRSISWAYWEFCSGFGIYDATRKKWKGALLNALIPGGPKTVMP